MRPEERQFVAQLCAARAGLMVDSEKVYLLESRLAPVARREGFESAADLIRSVRARGDERLSAAVVEAMAHSETAFFRDPAAFDLFLHELLPAQARAAEGRPVRVWSAACGSGQEIYSLAMLVEEASPALAGGRVELFGSDLSERALDKAQSGLYTQFEVQRGLPIRRLVRHFEKAGEMWAVSPRIRQMIRWKRVNLSAELPATGRFDVVFCREVLALTVPERRARLLENLAGSLAPGGVLVLGAGEEAAGVTDALQPAAGRPGLFSRNPSFRAAA